MKQCYKVAIIDDDPMVVKILRTCFAREGWKVVTAVDGIDGIRLVQTELPDLLILDLMLPGMHGWEVCRHLRAETDVPILMLTALDQEDQTVKGLRLGADDYVAKPFSPREILARAEAILRRSRPVVAEQRIFSEGPLFIDAGHQAVLVDGRHLSLTPAEFRIFHFMALHREVAMSRQQILATGSPSGAFLDGQDRTADAHIKNLRRKLAGAGTDAVSIVTVRGFGYKMVIAGGKGAKGKI